MPSSVHTVSRWLVVSVVEFHAHVTVQRWYEKSVVRRVRKLHGWYEKSMVRNVYGTKSLVPVSCNGFALPYSVEGNA